MVKDHKGRHYNSSDDSSDDERRRKKKKRRSISPEEYHRRQNNRHDYSPSDVKTRIKQEPVSEPDSESDFSSSSSSDDSSPERKPRIKSEHYRDGDRHRHKHSSHKLKQEHRRHRHHEESDQHYSGEDREYRNRREGRGHHHDLVRVKQEPDSEDEMRQQRKERRLNDQRRMENRHRREQEERRDRRNEGGERTHRRGGDGERTRDRREERGDGRGRGGRSRGEAGRGDRDNIPEHERYGRRENQGAGENSGAPDQPKDAPNFELSGKLTEDTNTYKGVVIKYNEPAEARKPKKRWRLYPFKNDEPMKPFHMHRQSAYLLGRDRIVADIPIDHPSCSKQHAVFQYRMVQYEKPDGRKAFRIAPYIIDLESANGTFLNNKRIEDRVYVELKEKDVIKFGFSSREYVLLHDKSDTREVESDVSDE